VAGAAHPDASVAIGTAEVFAELVALHIRARRNHSHIAVNPHFAPPSRLPDDGRVKMGGYSVASVEEAASRTIARLEAFTVKMPHG